MTTPLEPIVINPADHAIRLTTTLNRLKQAGACTDRYRHLCKALGTGFDRDAEIDLLTILDLSGTEDCLWALCATVQNCDTVARLMAADFAEAVLPSYERIYQNDAQPRLAIEATRSFALGRIDAAAMAAAWEAASGSAWEAASGSAMAAASGSAMAAAMAAAWEAAMAAAWEAQAVIIRRYLLPLATGDAK